MKEILERFDAFEKKLESGLGGVRSDVAGVDKKVDGLRAEVISRLAELEMRVSTALLDRSNQELVSELRQGWVTSA